MFGVFLAWARAFEFGFCERRFYMILTLAFLALRWFLAWLVSLSRITSSVYLMAKFSYVEIGLFPSGRKPRRRY